MLEANILDGNELPADRLVSMQEAMAYLSEKGIPCKSRSSFYRLVQQFDIPYVNTNPTGLNEVRRFTKDNLEDFIRKQGLTP